MFFSGMTVLLGRGTASVVGRDLVREEDGTVYLVFFFFIASLRAFACLSSNRGILSLCL